MDDIGTLIWRFAKRLITHNDQTDEQTADHRQPPAILRSPAAE
jgi:hypothetical protein